jgi:hypothetical protein
MRKLLCFMLVAVPCLAPAAAEARLTARTAPSALACGTVLKLGVSARNHRGSRRVKVRISTGTRLVYSRTVSAPRRWTTRLACGRRYRVVYRLPSGRTITRRTRVLARGGSLPSLGAGACPPRPRRLRRAPDPTNLRRLPSTRPCSSRCRRRTPATPPTRRTRMTRTTSPCPVPATGDDPAGDE